MRRDKDTAPPEAQSIDVYLCDHCGHVHFVLLGHADKVIAGATMTPDDADSFSADIRAVVARVRERTLQ
jgi:hypothetical protein